MSAAATDRYEGLNLPQLFDLMHDIIVPDAVPWTPQTDGWWVALAWLIAVAALAMIKYIAQRRRNRYRREALAELKRIDISTNSAAGDVASVVRRTALVAFARTDVASLYGAAWTEFLVQSAGNDSHIRKAAGSIAAAPYKPGIKARDIIEPAKRWVRVHRA